MNFKEWILEQRLEAERIEWEHKRAVAKAEAKRAEKHLKRLKRQRPPMHRPDPVVYKIRVTLNVRLGPLGELAELVQTIGTMSEVEAELQAKANAMALGYLCRGVVSVERL